MLPASVERSRMIRSGGRSTLCWLSSERISDSMMRNCAGCAATMIELVDSIASNTGFGPPSTCSASLDSTISRRNSMTSPALERRSSIIRTSRAGPICRCSSSMMSMYRSIASASATTSSEFVDSSIVISTGPAPGICATCAS